MIITKMGEVGRARLLVAFDELTRITSGGAPLKRKRPRGGKGGNSVTCDHCGHPASVSGHDCPVEQAVKAIVPLMPPFPDRAEWLKGAVETAPEAQPNFSISMETRGIVIHGEAFVVEGSLNIAAAWATLSEKLEALGIRVTPRAE